MSNRQIREIVGRLVTAQIEDGDAVQEIVVELARAMGLKYEALECGKCGGWADAAVCPTDGSQLCGHCGDVY